MLSAAGRESRDSLFCYFEPVSYGNHMFTQILENGFITQKDQRDCLRQKENVLFAFSTMSRTGPMRVF